MKKKIQMVMMFIIQLLTGFCAGLLGAKYFIPFFYSASNQDIIVIVVMILLYFYLGMLIHLVIHECGHLVFGLLTGYRFVSIRFGNLMVINENGKLQLKHYSLAGTGGQCLLAPPDYNNGNYPVILYNLGGCFANLLASLIGFLLFTFHFHYALDSFFSIFALCGIGSALLNGIPMQNSQIANDGANTISLAKDSLAKRAFWIQMKVSELNSQQIRLKDMPEELFNLSDQPTLNHPLIAAVEIFKAQRYLDALDFDAALQQITMLLEHSEHFIGIHKHVLINDLIYLYLLKKDHLLVNQLMDKEHLKMRKAMKTNLSFIRTQIAYHLATNNESEAIKSQQLFKKTIKKYPYPTDIESELELIHLAKKTILSE